MKTYQKLSLFLLLSAALPANAFNPFDTSGKPSVDDFDDQAGEFRLPSHKPDRASTLEQMTEEKTKTTTIPASTPATAPTQFPKAAHVGSRTQQEFAQLDYEFNQLYVSLKQSVALLETETTHQNDLQKAHSDHAELLHNSRQSWSTLEKLGVGVAVVGAGIFLVKDSFERFTRATAAAAVGVVMAGVGYFGRHSSYQRAERSLHTCEEALDETAVTAVLCEDTVSRIKSELEARLTKMKALARHDGALQFRVAELENLLKQIN